MTSNPLFRDLPRLLAAAQEPASARKRRSPDGLILGRDAPQPSPEPIGFTRQKKPRRSTRLITYSGDGHVLTIAPTGTGKTSSAAIPNALMHEGQAIILDIKGEIYRATARRRRELGQAVHVLDLRDGRAADCLNPLDIAMMTGTEPAAIARSMAAELVTRTGQERDSFWSDWAENLLTAGIAWLLADCPPSERRLSRLYDLLTDINSDYAIAALLEEKPSRAVASGFGAYLALPDQGTRPSVLASALMPLRLFDSDLVRNVTGSTTIDLAALVAGEPMTLYIIVPPARLAALRPLLRTWLSGLMLALCGREAPPPRRTLFLCDEIANLGRLDAFLTASTLMRGYGVQLWTFWQNVAQLAFYGDQARTILDNAGVVQLFGARNRRMAEDFAQLVGGVDADRIMAMKDGEQLLLIEGGSPRYARQVRYFREAMFRGMYDGGEPSRAPDNCDCWQANASPMVSKSA